MSELKTEKYTNISSDVKHVTFPAWPNSFNAHVLVLNKQLEQSQWWEEEKLEQMQFAQLGELIKGLDRDYPPVSERLAPLYNLDRPLTMADLQNVPVMGRSELQDQSGYDNKKLPADHKPTYILSTSGSTGQPLTLMCNYVTGLFVAVNTLRSHIWSDRNFQKKFASIRATPTGKASPPDGMDDVKWLAGYASGPAVALDASSIIPDQVAWILKTKPTYIASYPTNFREIATYCLSEKIDFPFLSSVGTFGEIVPDDLYDLVQQAWGVQLFDLYSGQEIGTIALQCPDHRHYHVMAESVIVEILDENDRPVKAGEMGKVVLTSLHNLSTPLIRYHNGDYAVRGEQCSCGRGLPVLKKILGRSRNMLTLPDGQKFWPRFNSDDFSNMAPVRQFQLIQHTTRSIEVKLVPKHALTKEDEENLKDLIRNRLPHSFALSFTYVDHIPRSKGGKYEDFKSMV